MTDPITFTDLSPELVEEFYPPCEGCDGSAEWIALVDCPGCGRVHHFYCDPCKADIGSWASVVHLPCGNTPSLLAGWDRL